MKLLDKLERAYKNDSKIEERNLNVGGDKTIDHCSLQNQSILIGIIHKIKQQQRIASKLENK